MRVIHSFVVLVFLYALSHSIDSRADAASTAGSGKELIRLCNQENSSASNDSWALCAGYVAGVRNGYEYELGILKYVYEDQKAKTTPGFDLHTAAMQIESLEQVFCIPDSVTRGQQALVVSKYLASHPGGLNEAAPDLIAEAFSDAWPCAK